MSIETVKKNMSSIQLEQLMTIKKELLHVKRISNYFSVKNKDPYSQIHLDNIDRINIYLTQIENINNDIIKNVDQKKAYTFLIHTSLISKRIAQILHGLQLVNDSIKQHNEESFSPYMPKPYTGRRYSSKAISIFMRKHISEVLNECDLSKEIKILIVWTFRNEFESKGEINPRAIETPHYYYDLPYFIPNIFHELNHVLLNAENTSNSFVPYKVLFNNFSTVIRNMKEEDGLKLNNMKEEDGLKLNNGFAEEFVSDIFAYDLLGPSYLFSLFYSIVYSGMDNLFFHSENDYDKLPNFQGLKEKKDILFGRESAHVIEIYLRIRLLVVYSLGTCQDDIIVEHIQSIEAFLTYIFHKSDNEFSLYKTYQSKPNLCSGYKNLVYSLDEIVKKFKSHFQYHQPITFKTEIDYKNIFLQIWKEKLINSEKVYHRNTLRKGILAQIFSKEGYNHIYEPYELTFFKFRDTRDTLQKIDKYFNDFTGVGLNNSEANIDYEKYKSFGIYNNLAIRRKKEEISKSKVEQFLINTKQYETEFYTYKIAMIKLSENKKVLSNNHGFGAIIQVQLINQDIETIRKGYDDIFEILEKRIPCQYEIYKILGPNDYLIKLIYVSVTTIFQLKNEFSKEKENLFRRTFTTIYEYENSKLVKDEDCKFLLRSKIRLKGNIELKKLQNIIIENGKTFKDYYSNLFYTPGSMDIEIQWEREYNTEIDYVIEKISDHISDVQSNYILLS